MPDTPLNKFSSTQEALDMLQDGIVDIYFIKKTNRMTRHLRCTLNERLVPAGKFETLLQIIGNTQALNSDGSLPLPVWDLERRDWRSFYIDSTFEIIPSQMDFGPDEELEQPDEESVLEDAMEDVEKEPAVEGMGFVVMGLVKKRLKARIDNLPKEAIDALSKQGSSIMKQFIRQLFPKKGR